MKRKIISICAAVALVVTCFTIPSLASSNQAKSGYDVVSAGYTGTNHQQVGGGDWWYGSKGAQLFSDYQHQGLYHGSSCYSTFGSSTSPDEPPGRLAGSNCLLGTDNYTYWRTM